MEQKINKRERWKSVLLCVCERRKESGGKRESAIVRNGLAALGDASSLFLLRLRQENSSLARSRKRKEEKEEKEEKEATDEWWERRKRKKKRLLLHGGGDESVEGLALGGELLHLDEESDTVADELEELDLGVADTVSVGDVIGAVVGGGVDTTGTTLLETEEVEDLVQLLLVLGHVGELDVDAGAETSAQVRGAGQDVAEMLVPHVRVAALLHQGLDLGQALAETLEDTLDVTTLLHGDDTEMVLLVDPDQEGLGVVVPDATGIGPVAGHTGAGEKGRDGLVEEEVIGDQLILLGVGHLGKRVVLTLELTLKTGEGIDGDLLDGTALTARAVGRKGNALDGAAGTHAGRQNVLLVEKTTLEVVGVQVGLVLGILAVSVVTAVNDGVKKISENLVGLLITGNAADGHDEGMSGVVHTGLDDAVEGASRGSDLVAELGVDLRGQALGHPVVVLAEVGVILFGRVLLLPQVCHFDR